MNSLRVRQLISLLVLVALGVSLLGGGYLSHRDARLQEKMLAQFGEIADAISVKVPVFPGDQINSEAGRKQLLELKNLLISHGFSQGMIDNHTENDYYVYIEDVATGEVRWQSKFPDPEQPVDQRGLVDQFTIDDDTELAVGVPLLKQRFLRYFDGVSHKMHQYIVYSERIGAEGEPPARLVIVKSAQRLRAESDHVQRNVITLFFSTLALVLVSQLISNYFIITPIREFENEVRRIELGAQKAIEKPYPVELMGVKRAINTLIHVEKGQKKRYRESMENLAHSLKTPLNGLLATAQSKYQMENDDQEDLVNAIMHMSDIVAYQLKRAVVRTPNAMVEQIAVRPILCRLRDSLYKVYHEKTFEIVINVDDCDKVRLEYDDLMELFGNLLNNACRFCHESVVVTATSETSFLIIDIDDDGMGFAVDSPSELLKRGIRDDSKTEGQGIGLAISTEIVEAVGGRIELQASPQVGARVRLFLPH